MVRRVVAVILLLLGAVVMVNWGAKRYEREIQGHKALIQRQAPAATSASLKDPKYRSPTLALLRFVVAMFVMVVLAVIALPAQSKRGRHKHKHRARGKGRGGHCPDCGMKL